MDLEDIVEFTGLVLIDGTTFTGKFHIISRLSRFGLSGTESYPRYVGMATSKVEENKEEELKDILIQIPATSVLYAIGW